MPLHTIFLLSQHLSQLQTTWCGYLIFLGVNILQNKAKAYGPEFSRWLCIRVWLGGYSSGVLMLLGRLQGTFLGK
jgi:hypothetical protein